MESLHKRSKRGDVVLVKWVYTSAPMIHFCHIWWPHESRTFDEAQFYLCPWPSPLTPDIDLEINLSPSFQETCTNHKTWSIHSWLKIYSRCNFFNKVLCEKNYTTFELNISAGIHFRENLRVPA